MCRSHRRPAWLEGPPRPTAGPIVSHTHTLTSVSRPLRPRLVISITFEVPIVHFGQVCDAQCITNMQQLQIELHRNNGFKGTLNHLCTFAV